MFREAREEISAVAKLQPPEGFAGERAGWRAAEGGGLGEVFG